MTMKKFFVDILKNFVVKMSKVTKMKGEGKRAASLCACGQLERLS